MKQKQKLKIILFILFGGFLLANNVSANVAITDCQDLAIANETYDLQNDVTSNATCFAIKAQNVKLNLNGHTVTYDNQAPIVVPNGSFENADLSDWDLTNAPNASRVAGTFVKPVSVYEGDYALRFALPAADQYLESANTVTLDPNTSYSLSAMFRNSGNNEVDPNGASGGSRDPIRMSISMSGINLFDFTSVRVSDLSGKYVTIDSGVNQYYFWFNTGSSIDPVVPGMIGQMVDLSSLLSTDSGTKIVTIFNAAVNALNSEFSTIAQGSGAITAIGNVSTLNAPPATFGNSNIVVNGTYLGVTWRGFQYTDALFTTGTSAISGKIRISLANMTAAGVKGYIALDDVRILKAKSYGVVVGPNYANSNYFTIDNGVILQGQGNGFSSTAINIEQAWIGFTISNLTLTTQGVNSKIISGTSAENSSVHDLIVNHNVKTIKVRDHFDGAAIHINTGSNSSHSSEFYNITQNTGIQTGLFLGHSRTVASCIVGVNCPASCSTGDGCPNLIHHNSITIQSRYTNDFAIAAGNSKIYSNIVNCGTTGNGCRGITISGNNTKVYDNNVSVKDLGISQEYNGCEGEPNGGVYGMQGEHDLNAFAINNVEVYGNTVTATATNDCAANALRLNTDGVIADDSFIMNVHDNTFIATATGAASAYAMRMGGFHNQSNLLIHDNTFETNSKLVFHDYSNYPAEEMNLNNNRFRTSGAPINPFLSSGGVLTYNFYDNVYLIDGAALFTTQPLCFRSRYNPAICAANETINVIQSDIIAPTAPSGLSVM